MAGIPQMVYAAWLRFTEEVSTHTTTAVRLAPLASIWFAANPDEHTLLSRYDVDITEADGKLAVVVRDAESAGRSFKDQVMAL